jgi:hypothetical protein
MRVRRRHRFLALVFAILILSAGAAMVPWAFHIGGRWTPVLTWWGSGRLVTKSGMEYPMFVCSTRLLISPDFGWTADIPPVGCKATPASARHPA